MANTSLLQTESGQLLTTEDGNAIIVQSETSNDDIQIFDFSVDLLRALLWQYNDAINLQALLEQKNAWYFKNQTQFWNNWFADVFDLRTANDFGLSVWSIILGQPTYINNTPSPADYPAWGFGDYGQNFDNGNFASDNGNTYQLPTETARILLQLRYFQLISSGTVPETNRMLKYVFANYGPAYLLDRLDMTQHYVFEFPLSSSLNLMLSNFDVLPRPAGVGSYYSEGDIAYFGFDDYNANFDNGIFWSLGDAE